MSISITQYIRNELQNLFGAKMNISDEAINHNLIMGHLIAKNQLQLKDIIPVPKRHQDMLYATGYELYQKHQYEDASRVFVILSLYDPQNAKYLEGLAATYHQLKQHKEALLLYCTLSVLYPEKLSYFLNLAEEFCKLGQFPPAIKCCEAIEHLAKEESIKSRPDTASYLKRATTLRKTLSKKA